jgi:hypothetical protein
VQWTIPCDPASAPATVFGIPRNDGEGLLCYFIRAFNQANTGGATFYGSFVGPLTGNASTATTLQTARSISITGAAVASGVSFNGSANIALNTTITSLPDSSLATISTAGKVANSATTATSANTANTIVARDASGNFSIGAITGSFLGNATSATNLAGGASASLPYQSAANTTAFLPAGLTGQVLGIVSGVIQWVSAPASASATNISGGTAGSLPYQSAPSTTAFTAAGTTGQSLLSGGTSTPTWGTPASATTATNIAAGVAGAVPYQSGVGATAFTAAGTTNQVLHSNGTGAPTWSSVSPSDLSTGHPTWDTSGYVGIGTSSQLDGKLTIKAGQTSTTSPVSLLKLQNLYTGIGGYRNYVGIDAYTGDSGTTNTKVGTLGFATSESQEGTFSFINYPSGNPTERLRIDPSGNVGIGTPSPSAKISVYGAGQTTAAISTTSSLGGSAYIQDSGAASGNGGSIILGAQQGAFAAIKALITDGTANTTGDLAFSTRNAVSDATLTERLRIDRLGRVGIGLPNPTARLQIQESTRNIQIDPNYSATGNAYIQSNGTTNSFYIGTSDAKPLTLITSNASRLDILAGGIISTLNNPITNCPTTAKAWVQFNGTTTVPAVAGTPYNVSSVARLGVGQYQVNYSTALANTSYSAVISSGNITTAAPAEDSSVYNLTTGYMQAATAVSNTGSFSNRGQVCVMVFGN